MVYCDKNENILEQGSEEVIVPYRSPIDNRYHRYFPDFYIEVRESTGKITKMIVEIKPYKQCIEPRVQKKRLKVISMKLWNMPKIRQNGVLLKNGVWIVVMNLKFLQKTS